MSANSSNPAAESAPPSVNAWVLFLIDVGNRRSRTWSVTVVASLVAVLGWIDYITGTRVSLGLFYLVPIILSALWLGWRAGCTVSVISIVVRVGGDLLYGGDKSTPLSIFWNRTAFLILYVLLVGLLHGLIKAKNSGSRNIELKFSRRSLRNSRSSPRGGITTPARNEPNSA